ncbi:DUF3422 family protein [Paraburkholderia aspalathi]|uniref:Uncharacterized membrane-anchored protein n=1 Tax=Paraburkholderia aspalathi TaxID=1324617 RepID=A0A1I7ELV8_9BURK|nr:DUF3422 domain-containing protein [Paraburkholderia aspalathi]SFU24879.1 Uncharacterized membrane-anchored protein [Paraburkholderia aspalathi]
MAARFRVLFAATTEAAALIHDCTHGRIPATLDHPLRKSLDDEIHSRPFLKICGRGTAVHFAVYSTEDFAIHVSLLRLLCAQLGFPAPSDDANHYYGRHASFQIRWELHSEFSTFTFVESEIEDAPFSRDADTFIPKEWLMALRGTRLVAMHAELVSGTDVEPARKAVRRYLSGSVVAASQVMGGGEVYCDWRAGDDGYTRVLVCDIDFREAQTGRLLQRIFEIETYRMMALLTLPVARNVTKIVEELTRQVAAVVARMDHIESGQDAELLLSLTHLAARSESLGEGAARFSACKAYDSLVSARIRELREQRIPGAPTFGEFMDRRLQPAMKSCQAVWERQAQVALRIARAVDLLRTRVTLEQERQTTGLLARMDATSQTQLRLQHAVEGLSVAAISYYVLSLITAVLRSLHAISLPVNPELVEGALVIPVIFALLMVMRAVKSRADKRAMRNHAGK